MTTFRAPVLSDSESESVSSSNVSMNNHFESRTAPVSFPVHQRELMGTTRIFGLKNNGLFREGLFEGQQTLLVFQSSIFHKRRN